MFTTLAVVFLIASSLHGQATPVPQAAAAPLTTGQVLPHVQCAANPEQSYALYLPSSYSRNRPWPLVISSDPGARGSVPLELQKAAAEKFGYVLASSNNSRNGPAQPRLEATQATLRDVQERVSIDTERIYFAGFSGGARFSSQVAWMCKCAAGVTLSGAAFSNGLRPSSDSVFPVFSTVGLLDFNYGEVVQLQDTLAKAAYPHWLRVFDGSHQWAPAEVMDEAFGWFRIQAMKAGREPRDPDLIEQQFTIGSQRAAALEQSGDVLNTWRQYLQIAANYESLRDVHEIHEKAEALGKSKTVREALKRESNEFVRQAELTANINAMVSGRDSSPSQSTDRQSLTQEITHLRQVAESEKHPENARVYKRALGEVFIASMEAGSDFLERNSYDRAIFAFAAAIEARPDSPWPWQQSAVACASAGKTKQALSALRKARDLTPDRPSFKKWLQDEPAFDRLRSAPEFQKLSEPN